MPCQYISSTMNFDTYIIYRIMIIFFPKLWTYHIAVKFGLGWWLLRRGFYNILAKVLRLQPGALLVGGPPCGSWIWVNRATSKRSKQRIFGDVQKAYVKLANGILLWTVKLRVCVWCVCILYFFGCGNVHTRYDILYACTHASYYRIMYDNLNQSYIISNQ